MGVVIIVKGKDTTSAVLQYILASLVAFHLVYNNNNQIIYYIGAVPAAN